MKKLILALVALAFAFAISSCCDQRCPPNLRSKERGFRNNQEETPYRWDQQDQVRPGQDRQHRRW